MLLTKGNKNWYQHQYLLTNKGQILLLIGMVQKMVVDVDSEGNKKSDNEGEKSDNAKMINQICL